MTHPSQGTRDVVERLEQILPQHSVDCTRDIDGACDCESWARDCDTLNEAAAEIRALREEREALREALQMAEWEGGWVIDLGGDTTSSCPVCGFAKTTGHANTCEIRRALAPQPTKEAPEHG